MTIPSTRDMLLDTYTELSLEVLRAKQAKGTLEDSHTPLHLQAQYERENMDTKVRKSGGNAEDKLHYLREQIALLRDELESL